MYNKGGGEEEEIDTSICYCKLGCQLTLKIVNSAPSNNTLLSTYASRPRTATARMS